MAAARRRPTPSSTTADVEPDYLLSTLRRQFELATGFARLCGHVSPALEEASDDLVAHETALFEAATASVLGHSAPSLSKASPGKSPDGRANQSDPVGGVGTPALARAAIKPGVARQGPQR